MGFGRGVQVGLEWLAVGFAVLCPRFGDADVLSMNSEMGCKVAGYMFLAICG
jgi:hypothetical protein